MGLLHFYFRMARDSPKMPQDRPKTVQDKPKTAQDRPNTAQDRTKAAKDRPKIAPSASCIVFYKHSERLLEHSNTPSRSCSVFYKHFGRKVAHSPRETHPQTASTAARNIGRVVAWNTPRPCGGKPFSAQSLCFTWGFCTFTKPCIRHPDLGVSIT